MVFGSRAPPEPAGLKRSARPLSRNKGALLLRGRRKEGSGEKGVEKGRRVGRDGKRRGNFVPLTEKIVPAPMHSRVVN